jgi:hypothetical protein
MVQSDAQTFVNRLRAAGFEASSATTGSEIAVLVEGRGFLSPCDWLQFGLFDGHPAVWLAGSDRGSLFIPHFELNSSAALIDAKEFCEQFEFAGLRLNGKLQVLRHKTTGQLRYIGRPFILRENDGSSGGAQ